MQGNELLSRPSPVIVGGGEHVVARIFGEGMAEDSNAEFTISVSEDKTTAVVSSLGPESSVSPDAFRVAYRAVGIQVPPDLEVVKKLLAAAAAGKDITGQVVARAVPPSLAVDARIEPQGDWSFPVFPGDPLGRLIPAKPAKAGTLLDGSKLPYQGKDRGADILFPPDGKCAIDKVSFTIRSETYGLVQVEGGEVLVKPLVHVSPDFMQVSADIHHRDSQGNAITPERMRATLEGEEVVAFMSDEAFMTARNRAKQEDVLVKGVLLCRGQAPKHGKDGWFEAQYEDDRDSVGLEAEGGRIDFRARGVVRSVEPGEPLGKLVPPEPGLPGKDVLGRVIPAQEGQPFNVVVGEGVEVSEDETQFYAAEQGMVFFIENTLSVSEVFQTKGDVDLSVGNISLEKGSVRVNGSIMSGFAVESPRNILVNDVVESAIVKADGDVEVRGGIIMDANGRIVAGGGVSAMYASNATIEAAGDVNIANEVTNCTIMARRQMIARRGRGKIIGGVIRAGEGVVANEIGSELGVETTILVGLAGKDRAIDSAPRKAVEAGLQKIYAVVGSGDPRTILMQAAPEKRQAVAELLKKRIQMEKDLKELEAKEAQERDITALAEKAKVRVFRMVHPGTVFNFFGKALKVDKPIPRSTIFYSPGENKIVLGKL